MTREIQATLTHLAKLLAKSGVQNYRVSVGPLANKGTPVSGLVRINGNISAHEVLKASGTVSDMYQIVMGKHTVLEFPKVGNTVNLEIVKVDPLEAVIGKLGQLLGAELRKDGYGK